MIARAFALLPRDGCAMELDPEERIPDLQRRRWRPIVIALVGSLVLLAGGYAYTKIAAARERSARADRVARGLATLHRCLLGAPLAPDEDVEARFRRVVLANRLAPVKPRWPLRCLPVLDALDDDIRDLDIASVRDMRTDLAAEVLDPALRNPLRALQRGLAAWPGEPDTAVPAAPAPLALVAAPGTLPLDGLPDIVASPTRRTVWIADRHREVCRIAAGEPLACTRIADQDVALADRVRLGGAADGAPLPLLADGIDEQDQDRSAVWLVGRDTPLARGHAYHAYAWSATAVDVLRLVRGKLVLDRHRGERMTRVPIINTDAIALLAGESLFWMDHDHVRALVLDPERAPVPAAAADLGPGPLALPRVTCASAHLHALAYGTKIALAVDGTWSPPLPLAERAAALTCRDSDVLVVTLTSMQICTATRCSPARPVELPAASSTGRVRFGAIDERPLLVWDEPELRLRFNGVDRVLFDDSAHGGPDLYPLQIVSIPGAALLLLHAPSGGIAVLRIDASGAITSVSG